MGKLKIAIIGAGVMGTSVAIDLASYNYEIILKDIDENILNQAKKNIRKEYRMLKMLKKEFVSVKVDDLLSNIKFTTDYDLFEGIDLVIENASENWKIKKKIYSELNKLCGKNTIYAINTSCISITKIASCFDNPDKVIGTHFMNPVPLKKMVETIPGFHTSEDTINKIKQFLKDIGKKSILINDSTGFVANRLSHLFMNEAIYLVHDNVASCEDIDRIFVEGYGHKMGPLATADLIGLDTVMNSLDVLYKEFQDPKFKCCPLLKKMVYAGLLGKKSGKGFFEY